jgi:hypothetical protein
MLHRNFSWLKERDALFCSAKLERFMGKQETNLKKILSEITESNIIMAQDLSETRYNGCATRTHFQHQFGEITTMFEDNIEQIAKDEQFQKELKSFSKSFREYYDEKGSLIGYLSGKTTVHSNISSVYEYPKGDIALDDDTIKQVAPMTKVHLNEVKTLLEMLFDYKETQEFNLGKSIADNKTISKQRKNSSKSVVTLKPNIKASDFYFIIQRLIDEISDLKNTNKSQLGCQLAEIFMLNDGRNLNPTDFGNQLGKALTTQTVARLEKAHDIFHSIVDDIKSAMPRKPYK